MGFTSCPHCHRVAKDYGLLTSKEIGSPIIRCQNCNKIVIDNNMYEWHAISNGTRIFYCLFSNYRIAIHWFAFILPAAIMAENFLVGFALFSVLEIAISLILYFVTTANNSYEIEKSKARVQDNDYIDFLAESGYLHLSYKLYNEYLDRRHTKTAIPFTERRTQKPKVTANPFPAVEDKNQVKKQELRTKIEKFKKQLKESDESYEANRKILEEAFTDEELERMVANGEFPADKVEEYKDQRRSLEMLVAFMPTARKDLVRFIGDAAKELAELECE